MRVPLGADIQRARPGHGGRQTVDLSRRTPVTRRGHKLVRLEASLVLRALPSGTRLHGNGTHVPRRSTEPRAASCARRAAVSPRRADSGGAKCSVTRWTAQSTNYQRGVYQIGYVPSVGGAEPGDLVGKRTRRHRTAAARFPAPHWYPVPPPARSPGLLLALCHVGNLDT